MIIRDIYFAAWAVEQGYRYRIESGKVHLEVDTATLKKLNAAYANSHKALLERIKKLANELHAARRA